MPTDKSAKDRRRKHVLIRRTIQRSNLTVHTILSEKRLDCEIRNARAAEFNTAQPTAVRIYNADSRFSYLRITTQMTQMTAAQVKTQKLLKDQIE